MTKVLPKRQAITLRCMTVSNILFAAIITRWHWRSKAYYGLGVRRTMDSWVWLRKMRISISCCPNRTSFIVLCHYLSLALKKSKLIVSTPSQIPVTRWVCPDVATLGATYRKVCLCKPRRTSQTFQSGAKHWSRWISQTSRCRNPQQWASAAQST